MACLLFVGEVGIEEISTGELRPVLALCGVRPAPARNVPTARRDTFLGVTGTKSRSFRRSARLAGTLRGVRGVVASGKAEWEEDDDASIEDVYGVSTRRLF